MFYLNIILPAVGGKYHNAADGVDSNDLVDIFASHTTSDGNLTKQTIQVR